jgi:PAS domain S-box-containing protein
MSGNAVYILLYVNLCILIIASVVLIFHSRRIREELKSNRENSKQCERFRELFERTDEGISHTALNGRFVFINRAAAKVFGFDNPADLYEEGINSIQFYADPMEAEWVRARLRSGKRIENRVIKIKTRNGSPAYVMVSMHARFDDKGNPVGFESIAHDIGDRVMVEQELTNYSNKLAAMVQEKTGEILRLEKSRFDLDKLAAMGEAVASLARLLSGPLSQLRKCLNLMKSGLSIDESARRLMVLLEEEGFRFRRILDNCLDFTGPGELNRILQDIHPVLDRAAGLYDGEFERKGIAFRREYGPGLPPAPVDPDRLMQIIINLLQNAGEAMRGRAGGIVLRAERAPHKDFLRISVEDEGKGISEQDIGKVFDPFFTRKQGGVGLGLPVTRKIVEAHDGTVQIESRPGKGTLVLIDLPIDPMPAKRIPL